MTYLTLCAGVVIGIVVMSLLRAGSVADELDLIQENERLRTERDKYWVRLHTISHLETPNAAHAARKMAAVARGDS